MKNMLVGFILILNILAAPGAAAQGVSAPDPRMEFSLSNSFVRMQSLDGGALLPWEVTSARQHLILGAYGEHGEDVVELHPWSEAVFSGAVRYRTGYAEASIALFGDLHALAGHSGPALPWGTSDFIIGGGATFTLPARSMLVLGGTIDARGAAPRENNYFNYESGLIAATEGTFADRFLLNGSEASSHFSITAVNPLDEAATFYYYYNLFGAAFAVSAVPEPSAWLMLAAGLLLPGCARRLRRLLGIAQDADLAVGFQEGALHFRARAVV